MFYGAVANRNAQTLLDVIVQNVEPGSAVYIDCWRGYKSEELTQAGYEHFQVNHNINFVDPETGAHTQNDERLWGVAKWRNKRHRGTSRAHLDSYIAEFLWRTTVHRKDALRPPGCCSASTGPQKNETHCLFGIL